MIRINLAGQVFGDNLKLVVQQGTLLTAETVAEIVAAMQSVSGSVEQMSLEVAWSLIQPAIVRWLPTPDYIWVALFVDGEPYGGQALVGLQPYLTTAQVLSLPLTVERYSRVQECAIDYYVVNLAEAT